MRITKRQLKQLIKEELAQTLVDEGFVDTVKDFFTGGKKRTRTAAEIQADIDATNAALKSGDMSKTDAMKALKKFDDENAAAGHGRGWEKEGAGEGLAGVG